MKRTFVAGVLALGALVGAACGAGVGSDGSSDTTAAPATTAAPSIDFVEGLNELCTGLNKDLSDASNTQNDGLEEISAGRDFDELSQAELDEAAQVLLDSAAAFDEAAARFAADAEALGLSGEAQDAVDRVVAFVGTLGDFLPEASEAIAEGDVARVNELGAEATAASEDEAVEVAAAFDELGVEACGSESESFAAADGDESDDGDEAAFVDSLDTICADARVVSDEDAQAFEDAILGLQAADENGLAAGDPAYDRALAEAVSVLEAGIDHREDVEAEVTALEVPADAEVAVEALVALNQEGIATLDELRAAFAADDGPAISALFEEAEATEARQDARLQELADELGAAECAPDED